MNETFDPSVGSFSKTVGQLSSQAKENLSAQVKREPAKTLSVLLVGCALVSVLVGYSISRKKAESRRQRFIEDWMREVTKWISQNGRKIAAPIQGSLEATKSAFEEVSNSKTRSWLPFLEKQRRSFPNLF